MQRYFIEENLEHTDTYLAKNQMAHHMLKVMRMKIGQKVELVDPAEQAYLAEIKMIETTEKKVSLQVLDKLNTQVELPVTVTLVCGLSKGDKSETIVKQGTQMGASAFIFCESQWSVVKWDVKKRQKKIERLQKIAQEAAEQAHRVHIPVIDYQEKLQAITQLPKDYGLIAYEESAKKGETSQLITVLNQLKDRQHLICVFGPEGGLSPEEVHLLQGSGFISCGLGPRILRAETAPLYFLSAVSYVTELQRM